MEIGSWKAYFFYMCEEKMVERGGPIGPQHNITFYRLPHRHPLYLYISQNFPFLLLEFIGITYVFESSTKEKTSSLGFLSSARKNRGNFN